MDFPVALDFVAARRRGLLTTLRRDGRPQQSLIYFLADGPRCTISITATRAKYANLRRDPRATLFVAGDDDFHWVVLDGVVELSAPAAAVDDATCDALVEYYRNANGEHPDWADYRRAMVAEQRVVATFTATSATGLLRG